LLQEAIGRRISQTGLIDKCHHRSRVLSENNEPYCASSPNAKNAILAIHTAQFLVLV
jgi:hypothetical protein